MQRTIEINGEKYVKQDADFKKQIENTIDLLGFQMYEALTEAKAIIAGGALLSHFTHQDVNDVDVYFRDQESMAKAFARVTRDWDTVYLGHTDKSITLKDRDTDVHVQFIYFDFFKDAEAVFEAFDFTVCMAAIELGTEELVMHPQFLSDVASRTLHFNKGTKYPYISLIRTRKYKEKGYKIGKGNMLSIAIACASRPITTWESAKEQLGGIYGYHVELEVEKETEFSTEKLHEVVTKLKDDKFSSNFSDYEGIIFKLTGKSLNDFYDDYDEELKLKKEAEKTDKKAEQDASF